MWNLVIGSSDDRVISNAKSVTLLDAAMLVATLAVQSLFGQSGFGQSGDPLYLLAFFCPRLSQGLQFGLIDFDLAGFFQVLAEGFEIQAESLVLLFLH
jgi:hypothetical protein